MLGLINFVARCIKRRPLANHVIVTASRARTCTARYNELLDAICLNVAVGVLAAILTAAALSGVALWAALAGIAAVTARRVRPYRKAQRDIFADLPMRTLAHHSRFSRHGRLFKGPFGFDFAQRYETVLTTTEGLAPKLRRELRRTAGALCRRGSLIAEASVRSGLEPGRDVLTCLSGITDEIDAIIATAHKAKEVTAMLDRPTVRRLENEDREARAARADLDRLLAAEAARAELAEANPTVDRIAALHSAAYELGL